MADRETRDYASAVQRYREAAEKGDADAQFNLGLMYYEGQGVPQDYAEAAKWFRNAAEQGLAPAQYALGVGYETGEIVPQDHAEAVKWFRKAAEQEVAEAHHKLGFMYGNGYGVPQDNAEAVKWFRKAAEQGVAEAQYNLGLAFNTGRGVPQDHAEAANWFRKAAEQGVPPRACTPRVQATLLEIAATGAHRSVMAASAGISLRTLNRFLHLAEKALEKKESGRRLTTNEEEFCQFCLDFRKSEVAPQIALLKVILTADETNWRGQPWRSWNAAGRTNGHDAESCRSWPTRTTTKGPQDLPMHRQEAVPGVHARGVSR